MSEKNDGGLMYKCRSCGSTYGIRVPDIELALKELTQEGVTTAYGPRRCTLVGIHECEDIGYPRLGVSDCIGAHGYPSIGGPS
jgi:hypothetical protein